MVNLLVLACGLKLMQVRTQKDVYQLIVSLFFLVGCGFIFNQSIVYSAFYTVMTLLLLLSLACHHAPSVNFKQQIKHVSTLSLQALPISILLFLVLPQLPPLWQTPKSKNMETGLAEEMTPGDIANLSQSSKLAFRATFASKVPTSTERYWRVLVMEDFDGRTWKLNPYRKQVRARQLLANQEFSPVLSGPYFDYEIISEPTHQNWLAGLDIAQPNSRTSHAEIFQSNEFQLISEQKLVSQYMYQVRSYPKAIENQPLMPLDKQLALTLPDSTNPKTRAWVASLKQQHPKHREFTQAILAHFTTEEFVYTLRPDVMLRNSVDQFLFDKQAGFCAHYASALAFSLRLGGIPARIVAGYQGGELIEDDDNSSFLSIYQYDAHAWVEAWFDDSGWQRLDPTALVSPDRINFGLRQAMLEEGSFLADSPFSLARMAGVPWLNTIRIFLADLDYSWSRLILGFNAENQKQLFKSILGKLTPDRMSLLGLGITLVIGLMLALFFIPHFLEKRGSKTQRYYSLALKILAQHGHERQKWQGPEAFSRQVADNCSAPTSNAFNILTKVYVKLSYQSADKIPATRLSTKECHRIMRKALKQLKTSLA